MNPTACKADVARSVTGTVLYMNTPTKAALWMSSVAATSTVIGYAYLRYIQRQAIKRVAANLTAAIQNGPTVVSCGTCRHSLSFVSPEGDGYMQCMHSPPSVWQISEDEGVRVGFPTVDATDFCGQWQPTEDTERKDLG